MIKRNKRNIGKKVKYIGGNPIWHDRELIVKGFRGDVEKGNPWVECWDVRGKGIHPFCGHTLLEIKGE